MALKAKLPAPKKRPYPFLKRAEKPLGMGWGSLPEHYWPSGELKPEPEPFKVPYHGTEPEHYWPSGELKPAPREAAPEGEAEPSIVEFVEELHAGKYVLPEGWVKDDVTGDITTDTGWLLPGQIDLWKDPQGIWHKPAEILDSIELLEDLGRIFTSEDVADVMGWAETDPTRFVAEFQELGDTPETRALLMRMGLDSIAIEAIYPPLIQESKLKDVWDAFFLGAKRMWHQSKQYFVSTLPNLVFPEVTRKTLATSYMTGGIKGQVPYYSDQYIAGINEKNRERRDTFRMVYADNQNRYYDWLREHPELKPREEWEGHVIDRISANPEILLDPAYWAYIAADTAPFVMAVMGTTLAVGTATANPFIGMAAGVAVATPMQSQELYEDLLGSGASEEQAAELSVPIGLAISMIEVLGDVPWLRAMSPMFGRLWGQAVRQQLAREVTRSLARKGLKTFATIELVETLEEVIQGAIQDATVKTFDEHRSILENIPETVIRTLMATVPFALIGSGAQMRRMSGNMPAADLSAIQKRAEQLETQGIDPEQARALAFGEYAQTPRGRKAVEKAVAQYEEEALRRVREAKPAVSLEEEETPIEPEMQDIPISELTKEELRSEGIRRLVGGFKKLEERAQSLPLEYKDAFNDIIDRFDIKFRTDKTLSKREAIKAYASMLEEADGITANIPEELLEMADKIPLRDMTPSQLRILYKELAKLVQLGKLKNKLIRIQAKRHITEVVGELVHALGEKPKKPTVVTKEALKSTIGETVREKAESFTMRTYRMERLLLMLDNYVENGPFQQMFWQPVEDATNQKLKEIYSTLDEFRALIKREGIDLGELLSGQEQFTEDVTLTPAEQIGIYLHSLNPDNRVHLVYGNELTEELIERVVRNLTPQEKIVADFLHKYFAAEGPAISQVRTLVEGKSLSVVENYFPIRIDWRSRKLKPLRFKEDEGTQLEKQLAREEAQRFAAKWASSRIRKGFLRERSHKAMQPIEMDALAIFLNQLEMTAHYKAFAPVVRDLQLTLHNAEFSHSIVATHGGALYKVLDRWLKQVAETNPLKPVNQAEATMRQLRVNAVTAVLGINLVTALKQFPSFFTGMAEIGPTAAVKGLFTFLAHPQETRQLIKQYAPQIWQRSFEREIAEAKLMQKLNKRLKGEMSPREIAMFLTITIDKLAVNSLWRGAFEDYMAHGHTPEEAAEYATKAIRRTQPFFSVKDLPEYWRSGELMKALTMFTNQLNQYWNYLRFDCFGKAKAGEIGFGKLVEKVAIGFILPAFLIGWASRSRRAEDWREFAADVAAQSVAIIPLAGHYLVAGVKGFYSSGLITTEVFDRLKHLTGYLWQEEWLKALKTFPELGGYLAGIPVAQPRRIVQGIIDLASGNTDDWLELIWGKYTRERARWHGVDRAIADTLALLGQIDEQGHEIDFSDFLRELKRLARYHEKEFKRSDSPFVKTFLEMQATNEEYEGLPSKLITKMDEEDELMGLIPNKYHSLWKQYFYGSDAKREELLKLHPELETNFRAEFRLNNPKADAELAFWGYGGRIQTREAYDYIKQWCKELGVGMEHMKAWVPPESIAENYFTYLEQGRQYSWNSAEVKLTLLDDDELRDWLGREKIDTPRGVLEIQAKWRAEFDKRNAWADQHSGLYIENKDKRQQAYDRQYAGNPAFRDDVNRLAILSKGCTDSELVEQYVEYMRLVDAHGSSSSEAMLYRYDHRELNVYGQGEDVFDWGVLDINRIEVLRIRKDWAKEEDEYNAIQASFLEGLSESHARLRREQYLRNHPEYARARRLVETYSEGLVEYAEKHGLDVKALQDAYVEWYSTEWPKDSYEDEWFIKEHKDLEDALIGSGRWKTPYVEDWWKVPTREVGALLENYWAADAGLGRLELRCRNKALDDFLVIAHGYSRVFGGSRCRKFRGAKYIPPPPKTKASLPKPS